MIRVTIELVPHGNESKTRTLHVGVIANNGTGSKTKGNYYFALSQRGSRKVWKSGVVQGFPRKSRGAWNLLYRVLEEAAERRGRNSKEKDKEN